MHRQAHGRVNLSARTDKVSIAEHLNQITKQHGETLAKLRSLLDNFVENQILFQLQEAVAELEVKFKQSISIDEIVNLTLAEYPETSHNDTFEYLGPKSFKDISMQDQQEEQSYQLDQVIHMMDINLRPSA